MSITGDRSDLVGPLGARMNSRHGPMNIGKIQVNVRQVQRKQLEGASPHAAV